MSFADTIVELGHLGRTILNGMMDGVLALRRHILRGSQSQAQVSGYIARKVYRALLATMERRHAEESSLAARRRRLGLLQREVGTGLGTSVETVSAIETERAKHLTAMDEYEALLDRLERLEITD